MSTACTKDDVCKFFDYQVNDTAKWTDKCGSERYLGDTCKPQCCNQQNEHCFKSQTAAAPKKAAAAKGTTPAVDGDENLSTMCDTANQISV